MTDVRMALEQAREALVHIEGACMDYTVGRGELAKAVRAALSALSSALEAPEAQAVARWPTDKDAEPIPFPKLPPGIVMHPKLGELFDRLAMQTYAMGYAMVCAASPAAADTQGDALTQREVDAIYALRAADEWVGSAPHGDNCFVSDHYEGDPGNRCNCGKDSVQQIINEALGGYHEAMDEDGEPLELRAAIRKEKP
jgi:hypothetical protein